MQFLMGKKSVRLRKVSRVKKYYFMTKMLIGLECKKVQMLCPWVPFFKMSAKESYLIVLP